MKNILSKILILSAFLALFVSCNSHDEMAPVDTKPTISALGASSGKYDSTLTITGTNFSTTAANNKVTINGVEATVTAATATQLSVTVPACGGNGTVNITIENTTITGPTFTYIPDVFAVGSIETNVGATPMLWKNGEATALKGYDSNFILADALAIDVKGNDITVMGYAGEDSVTPTVWRNGVLDSKLYKIGLGSVRGFFMTAGDIYIAGRMILPNGLAGGATIFKNDVLINGMADMYGVTSVFASGSDIHAVGYSTNANGDNGLYYKNGKTIMINSGPHDCRLSKIAVNNGDVYIVGTERYGTVDKLCLWKNGLPTILGENALNTDKNNLLIDKNDIYVVGRDAGKTRYWKNGIGTDLSASTDCYGNAIFKFGDDIYIGGRQGTATNSIAKIWKNGVATNLTDGTSYATVNAIFVR